MGDNPLLLATELTVLIEQLDAMEKDAREVIVESRRLREANKRLLEQIQNGRGRYREE
jgi:hypothetical protein